jgi:hypothetical protein
LPRTSFDVQDGQDQLRGTLRVVVNRVGADLVRVVEVEEQAVGAPRIAVRNFEANAVAFAESVGDRLEEVANGVGNGPAPSGR